MNPRGKPYIKKIYKNLYQTFSYFGVVIVLDLPLLFGSLIV